MNSVKINTSYILLAFIFIQLFLGILFVMLGFLDEEVGKREIGINNYSQLLSGMNWMNLDSNIAFNHC